MKDYILVYNITSLPSVIYASVTPATQPLTFDSDKLFIPQELKGLPIELRISMFDGEGNLVEMSSVMLPSSAATIATCANLTGLKLVKKVLDKLAK